MARNQLRQRGLLVLAAGLVLVGGAVALIGWLVGGPAKSDAQPLADNTGSTQVAPDAAAQPVAAAPSHNDEPEPIEIAAANLLVTQTPALGSTPATAPPAPPSADPAAAAAPAPAPTPAPTAATAVTPASLASAKARLDAGDLLEARDAYNQLLAGGRLTAAEQAAAREALSSINQTIVFSKRVFTDDEFGGSYTVRSGDNLTKIAKTHNLTWEMLARINGISDPRRLRAAATLKVLRGPFHAVVYKGAYRMDVYLGAPGGKGSMYVCSFAVGLGSDDSTPIGSWKVKAGEKLKNPTYYSPRGGGIIHADDPANPLGERWIALAGVDGEAVGKESYGIHGTIEPESIGKSQSLGCIRLHNADVELLFDLLVEEHSTVIIKP